MLRDFKLERHIVLDLMGRNHEVADAAGSGTHDVPIKGQGGQVFHPYRGDQKIAIATADCIRMACW